MARSEVHGAATIAADSRVQMASTQGERRLRRISAWLLLFFLIQGELGAVWDREWHAYVGRDQFWTPPHTLIYSCVAGAGLLALALVLLETFRYRRGIPGVNDASTVSIFRFFHAPQGFSVLGFGALLALAAAPLDNYWHELYGIDIALWAPFHMMGVTGGMIGILGMVYVFASEAAIQRQEESAPRRLLGYSALEIGMLVALAALLNFALTGFLQFPLITIGTLQISTYPLPLVVSGLFCMVGAIRSTHKPGAATLVILILLLQTLLVELFVPWAIRVAVVQQGLFYRIPGKIPYFTLSYAILPLALLVSSLTVDAFAYVKIRQNDKPISSMLSTVLLGVIAAPPIFLIAPFILQIQSYSSYAPVFLPRPGIAIPVAQMVTLVVLSLLVALLAGAVGALLGAEFGDIWRWSKR